MNKTSKDSTKKIGIIKKVVFSFFIVLAMLPMLYSLFVLPQSQGIPDPVSAVNQAAKDSTTGVNASSPFSVFGSVFNYALNSPVKLEARYENWEEEQQALDALIELAGLSEYYEDLRKSPDQRAQDLADQPSSHYDHALELYDDDWRDFVAGLDLSPEDKRLLKEMMLLLEARELEVTGLWIEGMITGEEYGRGTFSYREIGEKLAVLLSPAQVEAYVQHGRDNTKAAMEAMRLQQEEERRLGYTDLMDLAASGTVDAVKAAIADGIDVNAVYSVTGDTALMRAAQDGHADNVQALIDAGAKLDVQEMYGNTPLRLAVVYGGNVETVQALIDAGADVNIRHRNLKTPLLDARLIGNKEMVDALLAAGAGY